MREQITKPSTRLLFCSRFHSPGFYAGWHRTPGGLKVLSKKHIPRPPAMGPPWARPQTQPPTNPPLPTPPGEGCSKAKGSLVHPLQLTLYVTAFVAPLSSPYPSFPHWCGSPIGIGPAQRGVRRNYPPSPSDKPPPNGSPA